MRPVLFVIPAPSGSLPLAPLLCALAVVALAVAALGWRGGARDLVGIGGAGALVCAAAAVIFREVRYQLVGFPVHAYGLSLCAALAAGIAITMRFAAREGIPPAIVVRTLIVASAAALLGARLLYVFTNFRDFDSWASSFALRRGGFSLYGALLGGTLATWIFCRRRAMSFGVITDAAAPAVALGDAIVRIGCYSSGCDFGRPLGAWAPEWMKGLGTFPRWSSEIFPLGTGSPPWMHHVARRGLPFSSEVSMPVHPTQLYEAAGALAVLVLAVSLRRRRRKAGHIALCCVFAYAALRSILELFRDDPERGLWGPTMPAAWNLALVVSILAAGLALGPLREIADARYRWGATAAAALMIPIFYFVCRAAPVPDFTRWVATAPQWFAVASIVAGAVMWRRLYETKPQSSN